MHSILTQNVAALFFSSLALAIPSPQGDSVDIPAPLSTVLPQPLPFVGGICSGHIIQSRYPDHSQRKINSVTLYDATPGAAGHVIGTAGTVEVTGPATPVTVFSQAPVAFVAWWRDEGDGMELRYGDQAWNSEDQIFRRVTGSPPSIQVNSDTLTGDPGDQDGPESRLVNFSFKC